MKTPTQAATPSFDSETYLIYLTQLIQQVGNQSVDADRSGNPVDLNWLLGNWLNEPTHIENVRRALRSWFMSFIPDWEEATVFNQQRHMDTYELLDDLLCGLGKASREFRQDAALLAESGMITNTEPTSNA